MWEQNHKTQPKIFNKTIKTPTFHQNKNLDLKCMKNKKKEEIKNTY